MQGYDYDIVIYVEGSEFLNGLKSPPTIDTAWGPAVRGDQDGKLLWQREIYLSLQPIGKLAKRLPGSRSDAQYTAVHVGGPYFAKLQDMPYSERAYRLGRPSAFSNLVAHVCSRSPTWALFLIYCSEEIKSSYFLDVNGACSLADAFLFEHRDELDGGFEVFSR